MWRTNFDQRKILFWAHYDHQFSYDWSGIFTLVCFVRTQIFCAMGVEKYQYSNIGNLPIVWILWVKMCHFGISVKLCFVFIFKKKKDSTTYNSITHKICKPKKNKFNRTCKRSWKSLLCSGWAQFEQPLIFNTISNTIISLDKIECQWSKICSSATAFLMTSW